MPATTRQVVASPSPVVAELRRVSRTAPLWWSCLAVLVLGVLAPLANTVSLSAHDPPRQTANAFTSVNAAPVLALLLGVLGTTGSARVPGGTGPAYRRAVGAKARAYGLVGVVAVLVLGALAAAITLPIIHARGLRAPSSHIVVEYLQREAVAAARLAVVGVAVGVVAVARWRAVAVLLAFLVLEAIAEAHLPFIKSYGPIGALNAFSDPSHRHQLSLVAGAAITLAWALTALVTATVVSEARFARTPSGTG